MTLTRYELMLVRYALGRAIHHERGQERREARRGVITDRPRLAPALANLRKRVHVALGHDDAAKGPPAPPPARPVRRG